MNSDLRLTRLHEWIQESLGCKDYSLTPIAGDASFRRYFRFLSGRQNYIAVDAPPDKENNQAFINVTHLLEAEGLPVPHVHYSSLDFGFFLLDDFGDILLLYVLDNENASAIYKQALDALVLMQQTPATNLPRYDKKLLLLEMELFREWFLTKHLSLTLSRGEHALLDQTFSGLIHNAQAQPQVFVHRDYHSRNLMQIDGAYPGIIDYQDAVCGPVTYDLVSLLRDCYIEWPAMLVEAWTLSFKNQITGKIIPGDVDDKTFLKWFDLMGIQRHLKAIGIFARLNICYNKPKYLQDIPRTLHYIKTIAPKYTETQTLATLVNTRVEV